MINTPLPPPTVRDQIIEHLKARFAASVPGVDNRFVSWGDVQTALGPATSSVLASAQIIILDGRELKTMEVGRERCNLTVTTEFKIKLALGDAKDSVARAVLGEVQTIVRSDIYCGGLTLNIEERANELNIGGEKDTEVSGIVFWNVQYRHAVGNPRQRI